MQLIEFVCCYLNITRKPEQSSLAFVWIGSIVIMGHGACRYEMLFTLLNIYFKHIKTFRVSIMLTSLWNIETYVKLAIYEISHYYLSIMYVDK